jgi:uncharacterized RDD family membrane protein YckC
MAGKLDGDFRYATFISRVLATAIDLLFMAPLAVLLAIAFTAAPPVGGAKIYYGMFTQADMNNSIQMTFFVFLAGWPYFTFMESSRFQGTAGKIILGLKVTDLRGERIGWLRANGRYFGRWLSYLPLFFGFLMPLFTKRKQTLHDMVSGCLVLKKERRA